MANLAEKTIGVVGLGLIGGSFCKTIKKHLGTGCLGLDTDPDTVRKALDEGVLKRGISAGELGECDITVVALHPKQTIAFITEHATHFKKGSIVMDVCGIKTEIVAAADGLLREQGVRFVGTHPMAGREFSGYAYAQDTLFDHASFIITPSEQTGQEELETVVSLAEAMRFERVVVATPEEHDRIIAFTSQLAHVVSNAYIKSPTAQYQMGFSAGSFLDLTRVAKLNEDMWTDLFMMNGEPLLYELDTIIGHLEEYRDALRAGDHEKLRQLLKQGRILKEKSLELKN